MRDAPHWFAPVGLLFVLFFTLEAVPLPVALAAVAPAVAWSALVVLLLRPRRPLPVLVELFLWGAAVAAPVAERLNAVVGATALGPIVWGPIIEEAAKASGLAAILLLARTPALDVRTGIACGALVGLGFASAENLGYHLLAVVQGGPEGLSRAVFLRGFLQGLNHATFTAAAGAGLALASHGGARALAAAGFVLATLQHVVWNAVASAEITERLCGAPTPAGACLATPSADALYLHVPLLVAAFLAPGLFALGWLARRERA